MIVSQSPQRHAALQQAAACQVNLQAADLDAKRLFKAAAAERRQAIQLAREEGCTLADIATVTGLTTSRIDQIAKQKSSAK